ncbi:hypothetical protein HK102_000261 [Quaeritorhiza haematococci]|nr:hypothetical protein HK102_000261 [Quaeritorhiza haematococci]
MKGQIIRRHLKSGRIQAEDVLNAYVALYTHAGLSGLVSYADDDDSGREDKVAKKHKKSSNSNATFDVNGKKSGKIESKYTSFSSAVSETTSPSIANATPITKTLAAAPSSSNRHTLEAPHSSTIPKYGDLIKRRIQSTSTTPLSKTSSTSPSSPKVVGSRQPQRTIVPGSEHSSVGSNATSPFRTRSAKDGGVEPHVSQTAGTPVTTAAQGEAEPLSMPEEDETMQKLHALLKGVRPDGGAEEIPPEPEGECDPALQDKITNFMELKASGTHFNAQLLRTHGFRNPSIMSKLIEFLDLDEYGTNFDKVMFNPRGFPAEAYFEELAKAQRLKAEASATSVIPQHTFVPIASTSAGNALGMRPNISAAIQQAAQRAIQFVSTKTATGAAATAATQSGSTGRRKSKWDQQSSSSAQPPPSKKQHV